jgi:hypothetical protein
MTFRLYANTLVFLLLAGCARHGEPYALFWDRDCRVPREKGAWLFVRDSTGGLARVQDGPWHTWYSNGQLQSSTRFDRGRLTGTASYWHENGQLAQAIPYDEEGLPHGVVKWWNARGDAIVSSRFVHGTGTNYVFDAKGHLRAMEPFIHGVSNGDGQIDLTSRQSTNLPADRR